VEILTNDLALDSGEWEGMDGGSARLEEEDVVTRESWLKELAGDPL
jgi:hypothetical protein